MRRNSSGIIEQHWKPKHERKSSDTLHTTLPDSSTNLLSTQSTQRWIEGPRAKKRMDENWALRWHLSRNRFHSPEQLVGDERQGLLTQHLPCYRVKSVWQEVLQSFMDGSPVTYTIHSRPHFVADVCGLHRAKVVLLALVVGSGCQSQTADLDADAPTLQLRPCALQHQISHLSGRRGNRAGGPFHWRSDDTCPFGVVTTSSSSDQRKVRPFVVMLSIILVPIYVEKIGSSLFA